MSIPKKVSQMVEEKLDLVRRYMLQALNGLEAKEKKLYFVKELMMKSSEKLNGFRDSMQEERFKEGEEEEKLPHLILEKGFKELEIKREKLGLIQNDVMIKLEKMSDKKKLIQGLLEKVGLMEKEFEAVKKAREERQVEGSLGKLELIDYQVENRENGLDEKYENLDRIAKEIEMKKRVLGLKENRLEAKENILGLKLEELAAKEKQIEAEEKILGLRKQEMLFLDTEILGSRQEVIVFKENELEVREKILGLRQDEIVLKGKEVKAREKILNLWKKLDLVGENVESIQKSKDFPKVYMRQERRKTECSEMNGNRKRLKRCCRFEGSINKDTDDNEAEKVLPVALDINESGPAHSSHSNSGNDLKPENGAEQTRDDFEPFPGSRYIPGSNPIVYSNKLFNDFDEGKLKCLSAGQIWASYCKEDDLPRSYFRIIRFLKRTDPETAKLRIVWLQPVPDYLGWKKGWKDLECVNSPVSEKSWKEWIDAGLPVGCGVFKCGKVQTLSLSLDKFSVQVCCKRDRSPYLIHPSKGEIWALYKDWDTLRRASNPENHRQCKYEVIEVLDRNSNGTRVAYMDKLEGFVSLFQRRSQSEKDSFLIEDEELFRFSNKVPSFKMVGDKKLGVPEGSVELDPKDLPAGFI